MRLLLLPSLLSFGAVAINYNKNDKCGYCHFLVATFEAGLRRTARHHFAGGDTAWEERKLGKYATSETRFIETMEDICRKSALKDSSTFNVLADLEVKVLAFNGVVCYHPNDLNRSNCSYAFQCSFLVEENEEAIEEYYYKHQSSNMATWLCESRLQLCCPEGHYGKNCTKCPGIDKSGLVCYGHGKCDGEGSRTGSGKCKCDDGYAGNVCRQCAPDFFEKSKTDKSVECEKCDLACSGGCTGSGPEKCVRCRYGWNLTPGQGCVDINECETGGVCSKPNEKCINTPGSYECECVDGYKKEGSECVLDVEAQTPEAAKNEDSEEDSADEEETDDHKNTDSPKNEL